MIFILCVIFCIYLCHSHKKSFRLFSSRTSVSISEQIKQRTLLSDVIGHYFPVKSVGNRAFTSICPFHDDTNPSLRINDEKGLYHCFSCGAGGDTITFVKELEKLNYIESIKKIIQIGNLDIDIADLK